MTRIRYDGKGRPPALEMSPTLSPAPRDSRDSPPQYPLMRRYRRRVNEPTDRLASALLYLCTDARRERGDLAEFADAALAGGVDLIQLRDKGSPGERELGPLEARDELAALEVLADAARRHGALLAVNDRADIARAAGADILHLGQDDLPLDVARAIIGARPVIGRSTHDRKQADAAISEAVDYFCVGPCWPTPTKPGRPAPGLDLVREVAAINPPKPWFAIGGIDEQRLPEVLAAGARRIVVVRAITGADDPRAAAQRLKTALTAAR
jgi:thiamine-phosphate pyrophosphorylase